MAGGVAKGVVTLHPREVLNKKKKKGDTEFWDHQR